METILIRNVRAADSLRDAVCDLLLKDGRIAAIGEHLTAAADRVIDGTGLAALPGLFDMHVHFRDPGQTHKEDVNTGTAAALAGGVTGVLCMPNTTPPMDNPAQVREFLARAAKTGVDVHQAGTLTVGLKGEELADYEALKKAGVTALSDDGRPVPTAAMMKEALIKAKAAGLPVVSHCEDLAIINGGIINKGAVSEALGVKGMDRRSEDSITERDLQMALETGAQLHICHVSTRGSTDAVRKAKAAGGNVSCETAPHYFLLTDELLLKRDADYRMNPPLRTPDDVAAIKEGILDGTIDCIITDHAPHTAKEKANFDTAPNGVVGLETSLAATLTAFYHTGLLSLQDIVRLMSDNPRKLLHLPERTLAEGQPADLILVDLNREWTVDPDKLHSRSHNTVFKGMTFTGKVLTTITGGVVRYEAED
ncbi:MAG: dihydroorotase [Oscillospiraceae bacterium]|nr:dihydroorotase [Oscillospiraceae bacterium]